MAHPISSNVDVFTQNGTDYKDVPGFPLYEIVGFAGEHHQVKKARTFGFHAVSADSHFHSLSDIVLL